MDAEKEIEYQKKYEKEVAKIVQELYHGKGHYISEYTTNPKLVFDTVRKRMKIVPFDLKTILFRFYKAML